jgi:hypothetical protein
MPNCAAILGIIRTALFVAPILACKFSMDKPLTAEAMILSKLQEEFRLKPHLLDRVLQSKLKHLPLEFGAYYYWKLLL